MSLPSFKTYKQFHPTYPQKLFDITYKYHDSLQITAVDVGCGSGQTTQLCFKLLKKFYGIIEAWIVC
jgi:SAM-dependent methyltransferase